MITLDDEEIQIAKAEAYRLSWTHKVHPKSEKEKYLLKAQLKKVVDKFEEAKVYEINTDGVYFWNPSKFREFWESLLKEVED